MEYTLKGTQSMNYRLRRNEKVPSLKKSPDPQNLTSPTLNNALSKNCVKSLGLECEKVGWEIPRLNHRSTVA